MYTCLWGMGIAEFTALVPNIRELAKRAGITMTDTVHLCVDALDYTLIGDTSSLMLSEAIYLRIYRHYDDYPTNPSVAPEDKEAYVRGCDLIVRHLTRLLPQEGRPIEIQVERTVQSQAIYMTINYDNR